MQQEFNEEQLEVILKQVRSIKKQHPKANVSYDIAKQRIVISYPLPDDYFKIQQIKFNQ